MPRRIGQILLSGGLDSTTLACLARKETDALLALTLDYGQRHVIELDAARKVAAALGLAHRVVDVRFYRELAAHSALTNAADFALPSGRKQEEMAKDIPVTYVPLRNTFFLTIAAASLESRVLHAIEREGAAPEDIDPVLYIAANALDYSGYPDCRPEFYAALTEISPSRQQDRHAVRLRDPHRDTADRQDEGRHRAPRRQPRRAAGGELELLRRRAQALRRLRQLHPARQGLRGSGDRRSGALGHPWLPVP